MGLRGIETPSAKGLPDVVVGPPLDVEAADESSMGFQWTRRHSFAEACSDAGIGPACAGDGRTGFLYGRYGRRRERRDGLQIQLGSQIQVGPQMRIQHGPHLVASQTNFGRGELGGGVRGREEGVLFLPCWA